MGVFRAQPSFEIHKHFRQECVRRFLHGLMQMNRVREMQGLWVDQQGIHLSEQAPFLIGSHGESPGKLTLQKQHIEVICYSSIERDTQQIVIFIYFIVKINYLSI